METIYAQALWNVIAGGENPKKAITSMRTSLEAHKRLELLPRIARAFKRIAERELRKNRILLTVAHKKDEDRIPRKFKSLFAQVGIDTKDIETRVDDSLIGGWRLEGREQLIDASYKKYLLEMFNSITNQE